MPINALTSAPSYMVDYYKYVTGNPEAEPNIPVFWANILTFYNVVSLVTQILCGPTVLTRAARSLSLTTRFILALSFMMVEVLVIVVMPEGKVSQTAAIVVFVLVTIVAGAGKSYLEATCYVLVGTMPPKFMSAVMFGCGFSGVVASVMQCIIKASMPDTYESVLTQSHIYFSLALVIMFLSLLMALSLRFNSYAQKHVAEFRVLKRKRDGDLEEEEKEAEGDDSRGAGNMEPIEDANEDKTKDVAYCDNDASTPPDNSATIPDQSNMTTSEQLLATSVMPVMKIIYPMQVSCFCIFFLSLFIFPSLVIPIDRTDKWFATIAILLYNCGDATGRFSTSFRRFWPSRRVVVIVSLLRFLFVPLIVLCIFKQIPGHAAPYVFMFFIGLTNYFGALSMVLGPITPGLVTDGQKVMAGQLMGISLLGGASFASLIAIVVVMFLP
ncbi:putative nucleobase transporter [Trypanosoma theileri]|uniref:Putative nucleobase transporter n=1 Tax=Trypanosoma theileri TaxID=67003 RepID=A0A1X0NPL0_9TRYP|nr:putative nucleobase transporter [Trypanosoma theileri]ORC86070.1 putative nucleobase transporter [Trypanosoma theileri]